VAQKVEWVREGAGDRFGLLEFNVTAFITMVTDDPEGFAAGVGEQVGLDAKEVLALPFALIGSVEEMVDTLVERRERFGLNYVTFPVPLIPDAFETLAPLIARLAGT
jgi:hypothetical protein